MAGNHTRWWLAAALAAISGRAGADEPVDPLQAAVARDLPALSRAVAALRGAPFRAPVAWHLADRDTIVDEARRHMERDFPPARMRDLAAAQGAWGLLPRDYDLAGANLALFADGVSAYYDPQQSALVVPRTTEPAHVDTLLAHELVHAWQDQYHDLDGLVRPDRWDDDAVWAHAALVEGDATACQHILTRRPATVSAEELRDLGRSLRARLEQHRPASGVRLPAVLRENLVFPYAEGTVFVAEAWRRGGMAGIARCFADPPRSTEQILHPERYFDDRDDPAAVPPVELAAALGDGWRCLEENVLGEHLVRVLLARRGDRATAAAAAAGWDGLRYAVYAGPGGARCLAFRSVWDSDRDAREFTQAYRVARDARADDALRPAGAWRLVRAGPAAPRLRCSGPRVWALEGAPRARADACWRALTQAADRPVAAR